MTVTEAAKAYHACRASVDKIKDELSQLTALKDEAEQTLIDAMVQEGCGKVAIDGLGLFSLTTRNYLRVTAPNKPSFYLYLKESGNGGLLKEDVNPRTLTDFLNTHLLELTQGIATEKGLNAFEAKKLAVEFLVKKGASDFEDTGISFRAKA